MPEQQRPLTPERPHSEKKLRRGIYLTFEGPECSGKTTQIQLLRERLAAEGYPVLIAKQPGGTEVGAAIRRTLLNPEIRPKFLPKTESLLYWADRFQIYETVVKPAVHNGSIVLGDRDVDSSWAFQCFGRGIEQQWMAQVQHAVIGAYKPVKTILYLIPLKTIIARRSARQQEQGAGEQRLGEEDMAFHAAVIAGYQELAAREPERFVVLDGNKSIRELHEQTLAIVKEVIASAAQQSLTE